ncbi:MAG: Rab family GTPase [Candidatus Hermodarchaeota archaeon]
MRDAKFKVCIFGDGGVGKTTLVNRYLTGVFHDSYRITIGADFFVKRIKIDGKKISLQIWDFAGESRFKFILPSYIVGSSGCIFMFDVTRYSSIKNLSDWMDVFKKGAKNEPGKIPLIMVGGKIDLEYKRVIQSDHAKEIAENNDFLDYIECSSKTGENVEQIFLTITKLMLEMSV